MRWNVQCESRGRLTHSSNPLRHASLLADVNLLSLANKADNDTPVRQFRCQLKQNSWLGICVAMFPSHIVDVPGALGFIENEDVIIGRPPFTNAVLEDEVPHRAYEDCAMKGTL